MIQAAAPARIGGLDGFRGVAMVAVVGIHAAGLLGRDSPHFEAGRFVDHGCRFAVPFFMAAMGFMAVAQDLAGRAWLPALRGRFVRLGVPYLIWSALYLVVPAAVTAAPSDMPAWQAVLLGYTEGHLYFMPAYFATLLVTPLFVAALRALPSSSMRSALCVGIIFLHGWTLWRMEASVLSGPPPDWWLALYIRGDARLPIHWMAFFAAGGLAALHHRRLVAWLRNVRGLLLLSLPLALLIHGGIASHAVVGAPWEYFWLTPSFLWISASGALIVAGLWPRLAGPRPGAWASVSRRAIAASRRGVAPAPRQRAAAGRDSSTVCAIVPLAR